MHADRSVLSQYLYNAYILIFYKLKSIPAIGYAIAIRNELFPLGLQKGNCNWWTSVLCLQEQTRQESCAIAKMTARCALY